MRTLYKPIEENYPKPINESYEKSEELRHKRGNTILMYGCLPQQ